MLALTYCCSVYEMTTSVSQSVAEAIDHAVACRRLLPWQREMAVAVSIVLQRRWFVYRTPQLTAEMTDYRTVRTPAGRGPPGTTLLMDFAVAAMRLNRCYPCPCACSCTRSLGIVLHGVHRRRSLVRSLGAATVTCCGFSELPVL